MLKTRIYILQFLGVLVLVGCYLLRDQPDRLSMMHFDSASHSVIRKDHRTANDLDLHKVKPASHQQRDKHKTDIPRRIPVELMLPLNTNTYTVVFAQPVKHSTPLLHYYQYLFYEEINPPPPKC